MTLFYLLFAGAALVIFGAGWFLGSLRERKVCEKKYIAAEKAKERALELTMKSQFGLLHRHVKKEQELRLDEDHVIVDKKDWFLVRIRYGYLKGLQDDIAEGAKIRP
jgi:hypothetical protein